MGKNRIDIEGTVSEYCEVRVNGVKANVDGYNKFISDVTLQNGENTFLIEIQFLYRKAIIPFKNILIAFEIPAACRTV